MSNDHDIATSPLETVLALLKQQQQQQKQPEQQSQEHMKEQAEPYVPQLQVQSLLQQQISLQFMMAKCVDPMWMYAFGQLFKFFTSNGHCNVPDSSTDDHLAILSKWVGLQRMRQANGTLSPLEKLLLDQINFDWNLGLNADEIKWNQMFGRLVLYKQITGTTQVPLTYSLDAELGPWVQKMKVDNKNKALKSEHYLQLDLLGFIWDDDIVPEVSPSSPVQSETSARQHKSVDNNKMSPRSTPCSPKTPSLASTSASTSLNNETTTTTNTSNLKVSAYVKKWNVMFKRLCEYKDQNGDTLVRWDTWSDPALVRWIQRQRFLYNKNKLDPAHIEKLNSIGFVWSLR